MSRFVVVLSLLSCPLCFAEDAASTDSVTVECTGRIRHGVMAIGGETTGTTITSNRVSFELQLNSEAHQAFAVEQNKRFVVATGRLRKVAAVETKTRWIVDVESLALSDDGTPEQRIRVAVVGTIQSSGNDCGDGLTLIIRAGDQLWPLEFAHESERQRVIEKHVGQTVRVIGVLEADGEINRCSPRPIRVAKLETSPMVPGKPKDN